MIPVGRGENALRLTHLSSKCMEYASCRQSSDHSSMDCFVYPVTYNIDRIVKRRQCRLPQRRPRSCRACQPRCLISRGSTPWSFPPLPDPDQYVDEYGDWSSEFTTLCQEQLSLIHGTVPNVTSATVFFRREHASGDLEFVPLATYPHDQRVWISSDTSATAFSTRGSRVLPGGIPAHWVLPEYPFLDLESQQGVVADDGSLCVPIMFSNIVAGTLCLRRGSSPVSEALWAEADVARVRMVTRTIALAARLEGRWFAAVQQTQEDAEVLRSLGDLVRRTMHQVRSPVTALITFGRMLMQKLPPGDSIRSLAKSIVVEGFRLDELLTPLDMAGERLSLPAGSEQPSLAESVEDNFQGMGEKGFIDGLVKNEALPRELLWVSDVLPSVVDSTRILAESKGLQFFTWIDDDAPPVLGHEQSVREIVHNCLDNALKYTPEGGAIGLYACGSATDRNEVEIVVWDTGPGVAADELHAVWEKGTRGSVGLDKGAASGSGLGLAIADDLASRQGGRLTMESPVPPLRLQELAAGSKIVCVGPGTMLRLVLRRLGS